MKPKEKAGPRGGGDRPETETHRDHTPAPDARQGGYPIDLVLSRLPSAKCNGRGWFARCPAHDDRRPSLSIDEGVGGRVLIRCFAGCPVEKIVAALGLNMADIMPPRPAGAMPAPRPLYKPPELLAADPSRAVWRPFPLAALPVPIRRFVEAVAGATGTDAAFAALAALAVVVGCIGNRVAAVVKRGWIEPAVLWVALIGRSGFTKSPVLRLVTRALFDLYKDARAEYGAARREYEQDIERHSVRMAAWKAEQRRGPQTDPPEKPIAPIERRVVVSDITTEKLGALMHENPLGLLLVRDELAAWSGAFDRYAAGGKGSDCPAWLSMYDAGPLTIDRKSGGTVFVERAAVSVLGTIQPGVLRRVFGAPEREAGLLARIVLSYPPEQPAVWTDAELPDDVADDWRNLLAGLLALEPSRDEYGNPRPRFIPLTPEAKLVWVGWHDRHARETAEIADDDLRAHFSKLKGGAIRIALAFACVEAAPGAASGIGADAMRRAIEVVEWLKNEARRVYAMLVESPADRERRRLVDWLRGRGGSATVRDLVRGDRRFRGDYEGARAALDDLVKARLARVVLHAGPGRPAKRYELLDTVDVDETPTGGGVARGFVDVDTGDGAQNDDTGAIPGPPDDVEYECLIDPPDDAAAALAPPNDGDWGVV